MTCTIDDCDKKVFARGWCSRHWNRWRKHGHPLAGALAKGQARLDFERLADLITDDCVLWPHATNGRGYGKINTGGKVILVGRLALIRHFGPPPAPDAQAAHGPCHNSLCMNALGGHVRWGTPLDNQRDRERDGTTCRGERNPMAKLTDADAESIRLLAVDNTTAALASHFDVSESTVRAVLRGERWVA